MHIVITFSALLAVILSVKGEDSSDEAVKNFLEAWRKQIKQSIETKDDEVSREKQFYGISEKPTRRQVFEQFLEQLESYFEAECREGAELCLLQSVPYSLLVSSNAPMFMLYARNHDGAPISTENIPDFYDGRKRTIFIVHGWRDSSNSGWQNTMKDVFLTKGDYNVIVVDWTAYMSSWYPTAASNTKTVGNKIADLGKVLMTTHGLRQSDLYCVGHSLGAHVCGFAGKNLKFGRITGMDPAGPLFPSDDTSQRLSKTDADLVDVMHTSWPVGFFGKIGHVDFYPNGGDSQPACGINIVCSHNIVREYFAVSINTSCFNVYYYCPRNQHMPESCRKFYGIIQSMGFPAELWHNTGMFYLATTTDAPYCIPENLQKVQPEESYLDAPFNKGDLDQLKEFLGLTLGGVNY